MNQDDEPDPNVWVWVNGSQSDWNDLDPETQEWLRAFVTRMMEDSLLNFSMVVGNSTSEEMDRLSTLDSEVSGEECPEALDMIMGAYRKHRD